MATDIDQSSIDEGYWFALLNEGEHARSIDPHPTTSKPTTLQPSSTEECLPSSTSSDQTDLWKIAASCQQNDETVDCTIVGCNRGGLLVEWKSLGGFVPASQLIDQALDDEHARQNTFEKRIGQNIQVRIIELNAHTQQFILSERAAQIKSGTRSEIIGQLRIGEIIEGRVSNICTFGVFVDLGGVEGLIHISELSWGRVQHPSDILTEDQVIEVRVLDIDQANMRVALSLKQLYEDPWESVRTRYQIGEVITGTITTVVDFGAFVRIENGLEGLIHYSELAEGQFLHPRNIVCENETVNARILSIDENARRIGLSLRLV